LGISETAEYLSTRFDVRFGSRRDWHSFSISLTMKLAPAAAASTALSARRARAAVSW